MRDWHAFVRERLRLQDLAPEREARIVREIAVQLEDFSRDACARGASEDEADARAAAHVADWPRLAADVARADRPHVKPRVDRLVAAVERYPTERRSLLMFAHLLRDTRYAVRTLIKARGFTAVAVLTLALGIGANTLVFGLVNTVLLRPLPFDHPDQLVKIWGQIAKQNIAQNQISEPEIWDLKDRLTSFAAIAAYNAGTGANLTRGSSEPLRVTITQASADLLPMLGVKPLLGRVFTSEDDTPGREHVAVLDYGFWQSQMAGDGTVVGQHIQLNGETFTVIGVLPRGFTFAGDTNMWTPLALDRAKPAFGRGSHYLEVLGRVKPGVSASQAAADLAGAAEEMAAKYPQFYPKDSGFSMYLRPLQTDLVGNARVGLIIVFGAVGFVLLIACINLANLMLVRGSSRGRELAVRAALGASRFRIAQQLVTESVVIAIVGGGCGTLIAAWATHALTNTAALTLPLTRPIAVDTSVLFFALGTSLVTGIVFGLVPAVRASSAHADEMLKDAGRGSTSGSGQRLRSGLVIAEIALAFVLLVAAGLMLRSLQQLLEVNPGFRADHLLTARVSLPAAQYGDIATTTAFFNRLVVGVQALPAVQSAGLTTLLPMTGRNSSGSTFIEQTTTRGLTIGSQLPQPYIEADRRTITPALFRSMQIPLLRGRTFTTGDSVDAAPVIIVDEAFAERIWPDRDPIGQRLAVNAIPNSNPLVLQWRTVVGVVGHVKNTSLDRLGREQVYVPLAQIPFVVPTMYLTVRTATEPTAMAAGIQRVIRGLDPSVPAYEVKTMSDWLNATVASRRFNMMLLVAFGALALTLAAIGTYGVIAYSVSQRTQEIGIRMALGASRQDVLQMVVGGGVRLAVVGVLVGVGLAVGAGRSMSTLLFGVNSTDPVTFGLVAVVLLGTAAVAAWAPARRAIRVPPMVALRLE